MMIIKLSLDTIDAAIRKLEAEHDNSDIEMAHSNADDVLIELLKDMGLTEVYEAWAKVPKWYA